jgi:hypothetical protein
MALYISQGLRSLFDIYTASPEHRDLYLLLAEISILELHLNTDYNRYIWTKLGQPMASMMLTFGKVRRHVRRQIIQPTV